MVHAILGAWATENCCKATISDIVAGRIISTADMAKLPWSCYVCDGINTFGETVCGTESCVRDNKKPVERTDKVRVFSRYLESQFQQMTTEAVSEISTAEELVEVIMAPHGQSRMGLVDGK